MAGDLAVVVFVEFLVASLGVESFSPSAVFFEGEDVVFVVSHLLNGRLRSPLVLSFALACSRTYLAIVPACHRDRSKSFRSRFLFHWENFYGVVVILSRLRLVFEGLIG